MLRVFFFFGLKSLITHYPFDACRMWNDVCILVPDTHNLCSLSPWFILTSMTGNLSILFSFLTVLGFELRALLLQGRCSAA
jgi:hypothetical protein